MPGIEELIMRHCPNLNDKGLRILAEGLTRLSELQVGGKTAVSSRGILRFAQLRGQQLTKLELSLPPDFSLLHLRDMLGLCPNLLDVTFHFAKETHDAAAASTIILPKSRIEKASLGLLPSVGVGPFTDSVSAQLRVLALFECHGLAFSQIQELLGKCVVLEDFRLHLCCCGRGGYGMTADGPAAGADADSSSSSKSLHCLMLGFCQKVDAGAKSMARKVLELCPRVTELTLKFGRKLDPVALLNNRLPHLEQLTVFQCSLVSMPRVAKNSTFDRLHSLTLGKCMNVTDQLLVVVVGLCPGLSRLSVSCGWVEGPTMGDSVPSFGGLCRLVAACPALIRLSMASCFAQPGLWQDANGNLVAAEPRPKLQALFFRIVLIYAL
jgi:hypothetical protein